MTFEATVLPHRKAAERLASILARNPSDAEDLLQQALLNAFVYFHAYTDGNARGWLMQILRHTAVSYYRRPIHRIVTVPLSSDADDEEESDLLSAELVDDHDDPEAALCKRQDRARLARLISKLPAHERETLTLHEFEELSCPQIAKRKNMPARTIEYWLWHAKLTLAAGFREHVHVSR